MSDLISAAKQALEVLKKPWKAGPDGVADAIIVLEEALEQEQGDPVTLLPDGSAFGLMSFPLPDDHWIYAPNEYRDGEYEPIDLPKPILTHELRNEVVAAIRYAVRGATMRGQEKDFDPDALVQNAVYALCGPFTSAQPAKQEQGEPVAWQYRNANDDGTWSAWIGCDKRLTESDWREVRPLYTTPQQRKPLTNKQLFEHWQVAKVSDMTHAEIDIADYVLIVRDVEALHNIKE